MASDGPPVCATPTTKSERRLNLVFGLGGPYRLSPVALGGRVDKGSGSWTSRDMPLGVGTRDRGDGPISRVLRKRPQVVRVHHPETDDQAAKRATPGRCAGIGHRLCGLHSDSCGTSLRTDRASARGEPRAPLRMALSALHGWRAGRLLPVRCRPPRPGARADRRCA